MTTAGPRYPSAASADGTGNNGSWINGTNIFVEDGNVASSSYWLDIPGTHTTDSGDLSGSGFNFTIPTGSTIRGIKFEMKKAGSQSIDESVRLMKAGGGVGTNKADGTMSLGLSWDTYGGSSDLWGTTWTPADINNSGFGAIVSFNATHDPADSYAQVDAMRITVYYDPPSLPVDPNFEKYHLYKSYSPDGRFLGLLPEVTSDFGYAQDINNPGSQITVTCGVSADTSADPATGGLLDEDGNPILDEAGNPILSEGAAPIVGKAGSGALIANGNQVVVIEYSYYYPNGHTVFNGKIENWGSDFGGDSGDEQIKILMYANSTDFDNLVLTGSPFTYTADQVQTSQNTNGVIFFNNADKGLWYNYLGQTFTTGSGVTNLGRIDLLLAGAANVTVRVFTAPNTPTILASSTVNVNTGGGAAVVSFAFPTHMPDTPSTSYFFDVTVDAGQSIAVYYQNSNVYGGGSAYNASYAGGGGGSYGAITADLWFETYSSSGNTIATFTSMDPSTGMLEQVMNDYISRGGTISYDSGSIDATGLTLTAGFNTNTVLEGIKEILSLSPNGFYWYVDMGQNKLYFKQASTTADVIVQKGVHIDQLAVSMSIENVINLVLFSGGIPSGSSTNLYKVYQDATSIANFGQKLDRQSDNRVTLSNTADAIGGSEVAERKDEVLVTTVAIVDKTMDISTLHVGQIVGFRGFGTFVDTLTSQIVHIDYTSDEAVLTLGQLPVRQLNSVESIRRDLLAQQTIANPSAPS